MATASVTNTFVTATTLSSSAMNTNFTDLVTFLNNSVVHRDGSKAMTASLDMGGHDLTNLGALNGGVRASGMSTGGGLSASGDVYETLSTVTLDGDAGARYLVIGSFWIDASIGADVTWTTALTASTDGIFSSSALFWNISTMGSTVKVPLTIVGQVTASTGSQSVYLQIKRSDVTGTQLVMQRSVAAVRYL